MDTNIVRQIEDAIRSRGGYPPASYDFLRRGLERATAAVHGPNPGQGPRHVSGQQLCWALRDLALESWGPLAGLVLRRWNIRGTRDFGEMVFLLVELGLMGKQESDRIEDFDHVFDLDDALSRYEIVPDAATADE